MTNEQANFEKEPEELIDLRGVPPTDTELPIFLTLAPTPQSRNDFNVQTDNLINGLTTKASFLPPQSPKPARLPGIRPFTKNKFLPPLDSPMLRLTIDGEGKTTSEDFLQLPFSTNPPMFPSLSSKSAVNKAKNNAYVPTEIPMSFKESPLNNAVNPTFPSSFGSTGLPVKQRRPSYKGKNRRPSPHSSPSPLDKYKKKTKLKDIKDRERIQPTPSTIGIHHKPRGHPVHHSKGPSKISGELQLKTGKHYYSLQTPNSYTSFNLPPRKNELFTKTPPLPKRRNQNSKVISSIFKEVLRK